MLGCGAIGAPLESRSPIRLALLAGGASIVLLGAIFMDYGAKRNGQRAEEEAAPLVPSPEIAAAMSGAADGAEFDEDPSWGAAFRAVRDGAPPDPAAPFLRPADVLADPAAT